MANVLKIQDNHISMKLQQLEYFCAVAEEGSISAASRRLHIAQPPVSRQIALLEEELDTKLFQRGNKGVTLTQTGRKLYQESRGILQDMQNITANIRNMQKGIMGTLKIGIVYSVVPYAVEMIHSYHERFPAVDLQVLVDTPQVLTEQLHKGEIDAAFIRTGAADHYGFQERILSEDPLQLIMTEQLDPAPELEEIPVPLLRDVPFCILRSDDLWGYSGFLSDACLHYGFRPRIACQCSTTHIAVQMILAGFGMGYLPASILKTVPGSGLYAKPIRQLHHISAAVLAWNENTYMSQSGRLFIESCETK